MQRRGQEILDKFFSQIAKDEKLKKISQIIGFSDVSKTKGILKKAVNDLKTELKIKNYDNHLNVKQNQIMLFTHLAISWLLGWRLKIRESLNLL